MIKTAYKSVDEFYTDMQKQLEGSSMAEFDFEKTKSTMDDSNAYGYILRGKLSKEMAAAPLNNGKIKTDIAIGGIVVKEIKISIHSLNYNSSEKDENNYSQYLKSSMVDELYVKVPGKLISTNGFKDDKDSKMVSWDISDVEFGEIEEKELVVRYLDSRIMIIPLAIAIILVGIVVIVIISKKKKKGSDSISVSI